MAEILYSKIEGEGGIPFLVIHGYFGMSDNWKTFGKQMADQGYEVHLLDLRNHGRSFHSMDWSYDLMVEDVIRYMDHHNLANAIALGHSMGGKVVMKLADRYPDRITKLIVADIAPRQYPPHHQIIIDALSKVDFTLKPSRGDVDDLLRNEIKEDGTRLLLAKSLYWKEPGQLAFRFNLDAFRANEEVVGEALEEDAYFSNPTLFIRGGNSNYIQQSDEEMISKHFPNSEVQTIPNVGHWLHAENPQMFYEIVKDFLER